MRILKQSSFPQNMLNFRQYDGMKAFVAFMFALSICNFIVGMWSLFTWENSWWWPDSIHKAGLFGVNLLILTIAYCIAWLTFDRASLEGYVIAILSFVLGVVYIISPLDFIPDAVPGLSMLDDALIGGGSIFFSVMAGMKAVRKAEITQEATKLLEEGKQFESLRLLMKERGVLIEKDCENGTL